jgi:hypothetical protein
VEAQKYANSKAGVSDSLDTLLIYEGREVIKREPIRKRVRDVGIVKGIFPTK